MYKICFKSLIFYINVTKQESSLVGFIVYLIRCYQKTKKSRVPRCRFFPSCSDFAILSLKKYGVVRGSYKSFVRILKCNPWNKGYVDFP